MKVAVCGGRDYRLTEKDRALLSSLHAREPITTLLHGGCRGADADAAAWAAENGIAAREYPAAWDMHGNAAGPIRGKQMVDDCDLLVAFPGGRGTEHAMSYALKKNKRLIVAGKSE